MNSFTIRVYAACVKDKKLLALYEKYAGEDLLKLPGGGLEFGEGTLECLHREFQEELSLKIKNIRHFYTQEDFVASRLRENEQLFTVYYLADIEDESRMHIVDGAIQRADWIDLSSENPFTLPVDRLVFEKLKQEYI